MITQFFCIFVHLKYGVAVMHSTRCIYLRSLKFTLLLLRCPNPSRPPSRPRSVLRRRRGRPRGRSWKHPDYNTDSHTYFMCQKKIFYLSILMARSSIFLRLISLAISSSSSSSMQLQKKPKSYLWEISKKINVYFPIYSVSSSSFLLSRRFY